MAKQTERRVNKVLVTPDHGYGITGDLVPSDLSIDEAARLAAGREANVGMAQVDLSSPEAEQSRLDLAREWLVGTDQDRLSVDSDPEHIEDLKLRAWELQQGTSAPQMQTGEEGAALSVDAAAVKAAREARFADLESIHEAGAQVDTTDAAPIEPMNYP